MGCGALRPQMAGRVREIPASRLPSPEHTTMASRKSRVRGPAADRPMRDALIAELQQDGDGPDGQPVAKMRLVARRLIDNAVKGEAAAIKEIFERVDGRVPAVAERPAADDLTLEDALEQIDKVSRAHSRPDAEPGEFASSRRRKQPPIRNSRCS